MVLLFRKSNQNGICRGIKEDRGEGEGRNGRRRRRRRRKKEVGKEGEARAAV